jgi:hypothetical protein
VSGTARVVGPFWIWALGRGDPRACTPAFSNALGVSGAVLDLDPFLGTSGTSTGTFAESGMNWRPACRLPGR